MIKSFKEHYRANQKRYSFKIRAAFPVSDQAFGRIAASLDAFGLEEIKKPKSLPIQEDSVNFPQLGPVEITLIEFTVRYPANSELIQNVLTERAGLPKTHFIVHTLAQDEFKTPSIAHSEDEDALLNSDYPVDDEKEPLYGDEFIKKFLESIDTFKFDTEADEELTAETTNDLPQGTQSPMTNQNKLPTADDI